ncbi:MULTISPECIES: NADPH-dependent 7-cyano-7-deazaguanine reductase QueF [unclassified Neptuniibacter]|jgi:7-cyano-7-deazaguanine reductase|uniref:NADPH-dependent 7-cyano-7-deazaguanine reductase QueF n=1 Tax=unclassified Neptuniibacter TaxID=2630693 RepID=UPI0026E19A68|nr:MULTISPECIES: NADPH-dependent 7-cyano-7-deazaguanine reductase QueF [unclassified Neptuniibacter]MDO6513019.1 NADPH-dependent 7-cyano-7-deazaguanine reductase QueF [Neptuniibacter sp. 2_MG-2023]MDO6592569.1 NADPH-dependent 7-cyano-7-deazaguanine reductase QueF [Neptuniibacter sp. 1_MG-2023]
MNTNDDVKNSPLGQDTEYINSYDPSILYPIARDLNWKEQGVDRSTLPFKGVDIWNAYELSWINQRGKPEVRLAEFRVFADSKNIIESKSFKLYLNSLNLSKFESQKEVEALLIKDLSEAAGGRVNVRIYHPDQAPEFGQFTGFCIDNQDVEITQYTPDPELLFTCEDQVEEVLYSHLLKSNCPVTGQPDWATLGISYSGKEIDREGLLKYIISYREHGDFHEQCVENIFMHIWERCKPDSLNVYARYVRRGGLDINPFRSSEMEDIDNLRLSRQ